jgi:hypothetical protein
MPRDFQVNNSGSVKFSTWGRGKVYVIKSSFDGWPGQREAGTVGKSKRVNRAGSVNREMRFRWVDVVARTTTANGW